MIRLKRARTAADLPPDFTGPKLTDKLVALAKARHAHGSEIDFSGNIGDWKKAKDALKRESYNKCAYCEADTATVAHGDVEHFRPKSKYWWLALCLDNYVYSCQICNQTYKSDDFPVGGKTLKAPKLPAKIPTTAKGLTALAGRLQSPDPASIDDATLLSQWASEDADLPHPYLEDPEPFFAWKVSETNQEVHIAEPPQASARMRRAVKAAIDYLGLNRETHTRKRYQFYFLLITALERWITDGRPTTTREFKAVHMMCQQDFPYAGMSRYFARESGFPIP